MRADADGQLDGEQSHEGGVELVQRARERPPAEQAMAGAVAGIGASGGCVCHALGLD